MAASYAETPVTNEFAQGRGYVLPEYPFVAPAEIASGEVSHHPIVIVGGGLTGLTMACALAVYGIRAVLLDEDNTVGAKGASSRGICYTQKSLEIFQRLGIYERIAAKGIQWSVGRTFAGKDEVYSFDLRQQSGYAFPANRPSSTSSSSTSRPTWSTASARSDMWSCAGATASRLSSRTMNARHSR